jgi:hypothetical protein
MGRRDRSLSGMNAVNRFRVALWVCGVLAVTIGGAALYAGQLAYTSRFGLASTSFLIALGLFFVTLAIFWRPKTRN